MGIWTKGLRRISDGGGGGFTGPAMDEIKESRSPTLTGRDSPVMQVVMDRGCCRCPKEDTGKPNYEL
jgi:hypothetical protein